MGRAPCCDKANVKRGPWSPDEDATLKNYVETHGTGGNWIALPKKAGLKRCGKSCRLRWLNYLRPDIKHGGFTEEEDNIICSLYTQMGSRWSAIASQLPGRTDNDVKNYWNTKLKKKLIAGKITHKTLTHENDTTLPSPLTQNTNNTPQNSDYPASQNQKNSPPPSSVHPNDATSGFNIVNDEENMNFGLIHHQAMNNNNNNNNNNNVIISSSEIGASSSISDSSSIALDYNNNCVSLPSSEHASDETTKDQFFMDFGFGFPPYELVNGFNCHDQRFGEFVTTNYCYPELVDFSYADIKPH